MRRPLLALPGLLICLLIPATFAEDSPASGTWRFGLPGQKGQINFLFMISESNGKWVGDFIGMSPQLKMEPGIVDVVVNKDHVRFNMKIGEDKIAFDGRLSADNKKIQASVALGGEPRLIEIYSTKLKKLDDSFALNREIVDMQPAGSQEYFTALLGMLSSPGTKKLKPEEVKGYADKATKAAEAWGPRWQRSIAMQLALTLGDQEAFAPIVLEQLKQVENLIDLNDDLVINIRTLEQLAGLYTKAKKPEEAAKLSTQIAKLEARDFAEYSKKSPPFKPDTFEGRKSKSDRVVLVELFTGAECPPCVAADLACDVLEKTYKPTEVVLLQYHLHIPGPDPLTNPDAVARSKSYGDKVKGTPALFFSGKADTSGGGPAGAAKVKYKAYREAIDEALEKPAGVKLTATATQKGKEITIKANVADLEKPGEKIALRFVLAEELVRYAGGNGLRYHHNVVRAMPGGAKGIVLDKKTLEKSLTVNVEELRTGLAKYLEEFSKGEDEFPTPERPLALKKLKLVAFVQDDATGEVLQAVQTEVVEEK